MTTPLSERLLRFGAVYIPATVALGQVYWRLVSADGPLERGGNANIYCDVLDEFATRLAGIPVRFYWADGEFVSLTELKPDESDQGTNMPMNAGGNAYSVTIADKLPSDTIVGLGLVPWEAHKSYRLVWQRSIATAAPDPVPLPPGPGPDPTPRTVDEALALADKYIAMGQYWLGVVIDKRKEMGA